MTTTNGKVTVTPGKPASPPVKKIMPPMPPLPEVDPTTDDFLQFWDEFRAEEDRPSTTILGVVVEIPHDVPLYFDDLQMRLAKSKADSESDEARVLYQKMLTCLFGEGTYEQWNQTGLLTAKMLRVLTVWGIRNANGMRCTFQEAGQLVLEAIAEEATAGKPVGPNRATRRTPTTASSRTRASGTTGARSKRISNASTARKPKT